jgi:hypothetical protein
MEGISFIKRYIVKIYQKINYKKLELIIELYSNEVMDLSLLF